MWRSLFELFEKNKEVSADVDRRGGPAAVAAAGGNSAPAPKSDKDAGKDIPKDDKAKEEAKKLEEMKEMNEFIEKYGGPILKRTVWEFTKVSLSQSGLKPVEIPRFLITDIAERIPDGPPRRFFAPIPPSAKVGH